MKHLVAVLFALLSLNAFSQIPEYVPTDGLVAWYPLDGNASDFSGNSHHGTINGASSAADRNNMVEMALDFDGVNDGVFIPHHDDFLTSEQTITFWMNVEASELLNTPGLSNSMGLINKTNQELPNSQNRFFTINLGGIDEPSFEPFTINLAGSTGFIVDPESSVESTSSDSIIFSNNWYFIAAVMTDSSLQIFVDGELVASNALLHPRLINSDDIKIGVDYKFNPNRYFKGRLDEIGFFSRALTTVEILGMYQPGLPQTVEGCVDPESCTFDHEANQDDGSCVYLDLNVPTVCDATSMLECSALVEGIDVANNSVVDGYDYVGSFENSIYFLSQQSFSPPAGWNQQEEFAQSMGGHLADIHSEEENSFIFNSILEAGWNEGTWMGMTDAEEEGNWVWTSGQPVTYTNWSPSEPNNSGGGEHWMHMWGDINSSWNDHRNALNTKCLIELPNLGILNWNNGQQGLTASYPAFTSAVQATLIVDGTELCSAFQTVLVGQGCNDPAACNFSENDSCNVSCLYVLDGVDCGLASSSVCGEGTVWDETSQTCIVANPSDANFDGCVQLSDLLDILSVYGMCFDSNSCESVTYQGYDYETVLVGEQCWFAENLRVEHYTNGQPITEVQASADWEQVSSGARAVVGDNAVISVEEYNANLEAFGRIYNGYATMDARGLCPSGWHLPSDADWIQMEMHLGLDEGSANSNGYRGDEGVLLKSSESDSPSWNGNNESGWSGLPGGNRGGIGNFNQVNNYGYWWTSTVEGELDGMPWVFTRSLATDNDAIYRDSTVLTTGNSVRCVQDE